MNGGKSRIIYDKASGALSIEVKRGRSVDSDISGNVVIDYDRRGEIVRLNLYPFRFDTFRKNQKALRHFAKRAAIPFMAA
ncbi:MAG: hypothetical protein A3B37_00865 [Candidatus Sungbacteria bacterium RIFCSPLOWO2_01_FULL_59_16]|uniref:DUF2283 domain-containing protein n=1 Tax=Candidatus Sungbacteria bacterium RIFCSPLOWO2_01_FULL_59_16 TaxID=1802280 RepID=A0A1G2LE55_9BACT|nr:MAG: hypothetical protein A3B37_00865 [Candidatus Sungbacteria bacterium RIFCSPLOWO2_01_FULL_59_16]